MTGFVEARGHKQWQAAHCPKLFGRFAGALHGEVRLHGEEVREGGAFLVGELAAKTIGVENSLALREGHLADVTKGAGYKTSAVLGKAAELLHRSSNLLPLWRAEPLHGFGALEQATALFRLHIVKLGESILHALLGLPRKLAEAGFILQRLLLLRERQIPVAGDPLRKMLLRRSRQAGVALTLSEGWSRSGGRRSSGLRKQSGRIRNQADRTKGNLEREG